QPQHPRLDLTTRNAGDAPALYSRGYHAYWEHKYTEALEYLDAAVRLAPRNVLAWYYKGLTEEALGDAPACQESLKRGAEVQRKYPSNDAAIRTALERVQGRQRQLINEALRGATN